MTTPHHPINKLQTIPGLLSLAVALGARGVPQWSEQEERVASDLPPVANQTIAEAKNAISQGHDPLGDQFCAILSADERRPLGATYTPRPIIDGMLTWAGKQAKPSRIVDPGVGSARFLVAAASIFDDAHLIGVDVDPIALILAKGHLAAAGMAQRSSLLLCDYRDLVLAPQEAPTLFLGNPPYVRHHLISPERKAWLTNTARRLGLDASQLAGLHVHFFLATATMMRPGDIGAFITASEWLDVNYGRLVRELLLGPLGVNCVHVIEPTANPFPRTATTAAITGFTAGSHDRSIGLRRVASMDDLGAMETDWSVRRERLETAHRWTPLTRPARNHREGFVELGELCRVHRGQVTGANRVWIAGEHSKDLPQSVLFPSITKAKELFAAAGEITDLSALRSVIDIPSDLATLEASDLRLVERFLKKARSMGADGGFVATHRRAWWAVGLRQPAPILATYMARRPPAFAMNAAAARHINIAHGLYPRETLSTENLRNLAQFLSSSISTHEGRTYAGGLTKFEPKEMERLLVPGPELLSYNALKAI